LPHIHSLILRQQ